MTMNPMKLTLLTLLDLLSLRFSVFLKNVIAGNPRVEATNVTSNCGEVKYRRLISLSDRLRGIATTIANSRRFIKEACTPQKID